MDLVALATNINAELGVYPTTEQAQRIADAVMPKGNKPLVVVSVNGGLADYSLFGFADVLLIDWDSINDGGISDDDLDALIAKAEQLVPAREGHVILHDLHEVKALREGRLEQEMREDAERRQREIEHARAVLVEAGEL